MYEYITVSMNLTLIIMVALFIAGGIGFYYISKYVFMHKEVIFYFGKTDYVINSIAENEVYLSYNNIKVIRNCPIGKYEYYNLYYYAHPKVQMVVVENQGTVFKINGTNLTRFNIPRHYTDSISTYGSFTDTSTAKYVYKTDATNHLTFNTANVVKVESDIFTKLIVPLG